MKTDHGEVFTQLVLEVFKLSGLLISEGDRIAGQFGLSSARWKVLGAVALAERPLTVAQIARAMGQARQSVQRIADSMAKSGHFSWKDNPEHKRAKLLCLTKKGQHTYQMLDSVQTPWANDVGALISEEDLKNALSVIRTLVERFET